MECPQALGGTGAVPSLVLEFPLTQQRFLGLNQAQDWECQERWTIPEYLLRLRMHQGRIQTFKILFRLKLDHIWWKKNHYGARTWWNFTALSLLKVDFCQMGWKRIPDGFPGEKFLEPMSSISSGRDENELEGEAGKSATAHSQQEIKGKEEWLWERVGKWDLGKSKPS